jgi:hypothetical protein
MCGCGPGAPQLADTALRDCLLTWIVKNYELASEDQELKVKLEDGTLLDADLTGQLLSRLGMRMRGLASSSKKRKI